jgi:hypothetical protein
MKYTPTHKDRCEDTDCKGYGKPLVDGGYGYPVCETAQWRSKRYPGALIKCAAARMAEPEVYHLISNEIIKSIITQVGTMRRAANRMNDSDSVQTNAALDNIKGMVTHNLFECNVSPNFDIKVESTTQDIVEWNGETIA